MNKAKTTLDNNIIKKLFIYPDSVVFIHIFSIHTQKVLIRYDVYLDLLCFSPSTVLHVLDIQFAMNSHEI